MIANARILVVRESDSGAGSIEGTLKDLECAECITESSGEQGVEKAAQMRPDLALVELGLEGAVSGVEAARKIRGQYGVPVIYLVGQDTEELLRAAQSTHPSGYVVEPVSARQLRLNIETALSVHGREEHRLETDKQLDLAGVDKASRYELMKTVFDNMDEGVIVADVTGRLVFFNSAAERIVGMGLTETLPGDWAETYGLYLPGGKTLLPAEENPLARAIQGESVDEMEVYLRNDNIPDGIYVKTSARPIVNGGASEVIAGVAVFSDITKHKELEIQLLESIEESRKQTRLMQTVFNSVSDGVVVASSEGEFLFVNSAAERIVGMGVTDSPPDQWSETYGTYYPDKKTIFPSGELPLARAMRGEDVSDVELYIRNPETPQGVYISVNARQLHDDSEKGEVSGGVIVFRDITMLKETENRLKETIRELQEQTFLMQTVFDSIGDGVIVANEDGDFMFVNDSANEIVGMAMREIEGPARRINEHIQEHGLFHSDKRTLFSDDELPLVRAVRGEATDQIDIFIRNENRPDGVHVSVSGRPLKDDSDNIFGGVIVFRDVSQIKETEEQLKETAEKLQMQTHTMETVINSISDGVVVADESGNFMFFNESAERIVGIGQTDTGPDQWTDRYGIFFNDRETPFPTEELPLVQAIRGESVDEVEMFIRNRNVPEGVYISVSGRPLHDDSGLAKGGVIAFRDVTERIRADEALAEAFAHGRLEIIDTVLHNIGNAINSVSIGLGTVRNGLERSRLSTRLGALASALEEHQDDLGAYLRTNPQGQKAVPFLLALAEDLVAQETRFGKTITRVEGRVSYIADIVRTQKSLDSVSTVRKDIDLRKAIDASIAMMQESLARRAVEIVVDCKGAPATIRVHESKFNQMMLNLIKNGVEAIDELAASGQLETRPRIEIRTRVRDDFLVLDVTDNGIGIEEKNFRIIFSAGYSTKLTGSGLGLHSIANFVLSSGGQIFPLSDGTGKGTTMRIKFRLSTVDASAHD